MIKNLHRTIHSAGMLFLSCGLLAWGGTAYSAVAPVVSTLASITEGAVTPVRVASDQSGNIYVTDPRGGGVLKYNSAGNLLQIIETTSKKIFGAAIAKSGDILVSQGTVVAVYSSAGNYKFSFGIFGSANGIAVDDTGAIFVVDSKNNNVQVFNLDYTSRSTFGSVGSAAGQFKQPAGITFEKVSRQLAVADTLNGRVQFFSTTGVYQKVVGSFGSGPLKFTSPQGIAFEYTSDGTVLNRMYVVDSFQANIQAIDAASSSFLRYIGSYGTRGGQLVTPGDILLDPLNRLVIPNGTGSLVVFGVEGASATSGSAIPFPVPSTGGNPPLLTLDPRQISVTNRTPVTVSGTATIGAVVSIFGSSQTTTADASGNWTLQASLTQQGFNTITITASKAGSTSTISTSIRLDNVAPVVTVSAIPPSGSTSSTPIQTIAGFVSDTTASSVTITVNGVLLTIPVNDGFYATAVTLKSGSNNISVTPTDAAGNPGVSSSSNVTYNPLAPAITLITPSGAVSGSASYTVTGTAPLNSQLYVNGVAATVAGSRWSTTVPLQIGNNPIIVTATVAGSSLASTLSSSVTYAPGLPSLAVTSPAADSATANATVKVSGMASPGSSITASLNGITLPVIAASDGSFSVSLPQLTASGTYTVTISAIDSNGKISTTNRSIVYDPTPPALTVLDSAPTSIKVISSNGIVVARDRNGSISTPTNGTSSLDLTGAAYDQATLDIHVLTATGISSRDGNINGNGTVDIADALLAAQVSIGAAPALTFEQMLHADVGPLVNHLPVPDGKIRLDDVILILQKTVGIDW